MMQTMALVSAMMVFLIKTTNGGGPSFPISDFSFESVVGCVNSIFHFTNKTVGDYTYQWKVNDVLVSTSFNLDYAFSIAGIQSVKLVATNGNGSDKKLFK
jgi:PKD repeat protein